MDTSIPIDGTGQEPTTPVTSVSDGSDGVFTFARECRMLIVRNSTTGRLYWKLNATTITPNDGAADFLEVGESIALGTLRFSSVCVHPVGDDAVFSGATPTASVRAW